MSQRQTQQRQAIIDAIKFAHGPLKPADILERASVEVPSLGIATVYRHINRLLEADEIQAVELGVNDVRYESKNRGHQHHFVCRQCGDAFDIEGCPGNINQMAPAGFEVEDHDVTLYGKCPDCVSPDSKAVD